MVREALENDIEGIARVWIAAWRWAYASVLPADFIEARCDLGRRMDNARADLSRGRMLVVDEEGVQGFARALVPSSRAGFDAEISGLYVHPDASRKGVGHALVRAMAGEFLHQGCRSMAIQTLRDNAIGRGFYEKIGGDLVGTDEWSGFPCVWYGWDEARLVRLARS